MCCLKRVNACQFCVTGGSSDKRQPVRGSDDVSRVRRHDGLWRGARSADWSLGTHVTATSLLLTGRYWSVYVTIMQVDGTDYTLLSPNRRHMNWFYVAVVATLVVAGDENGEFYTWSQRQHNVWIKIYRSLTDQTNLNVKISAPSGAKLPLSKFRYF